MKIQYFGDVNDYQKFALLRLLAMEGGFKIGVCWMLTEPDNKLEGNNRSYAHYPEKWRRFDPALFDALSAVPPRPIMADLKKIESDGIIDGGVFFDKWTPDGLVERNQFHNECMTALENSELAFFDPDIGLEIASRPKGRRYSNQYVMEQELADHYRAGRSTLVYQHFPRVSRSIFIYNVAGRLSARLPSASIWLITTANVVFALSVRPNHVDRMGSIVDAMDGRLWLPNFFKSGHFHSTARASTQHANVATATPGVR
jgi:hypothetical protein